MTHATTRRAVHSAVEALNDKARRLGWERTYRFEPGSNSNGVQHRLETISPHVHHAIQRTPIGNTYSKALRYVEALSHALQDALLERSSARAAALARGGWTDESKIFDPDARSRRPGEE